MARKKTREATVETNDVQTNGAADATATAVAIPLPMVGDTPPERPPERPPVPEKQRPAVSWRISSDKTTSVEVACWVNTYTNGQGEEYEQVTVTVQRSYKADQGWQTQPRPIWRVHDLPVLQMLLTRAHQWALDRRMTVNDSSVPF